MRRERSVLITGGYGFLGRHVARAFADAGSHVTGIGHGVWPDNDVQRWGLDRWHDSPVTLDALLSHCSAPDVLVHCAGGGQVDISLEQPLRDFRSNVDTTAAALEFVRTRAPHAAMLYISSAAVYGQATPGRLSEAVPAAPVSPYGVHKHLAEQLCASYAEHFGLRVGVLRLFSLYGPGLRKQLLWDACRRLSDGVAAFSGTGGELRDWLHVTDAASLAVTLAATVRGRYTVVNGGTGVAVSVAGILAELAAALGGGEAVFSGQSRPGDPASLVADVTLARSLGWQPRRNWRQGVREYADWYRSSA